MYKRSLIILLFLSGFCYAQNQSFVGVYLSPSSSKPSACGVLFHTTQNHSYILTASHVLEKHKTLRMILLNSNVGVTGKAIYDNPNEDVSMLQTRRLKAKFRYISKEQPKTGQTIFYEGLRSGIFSARTTTIVDMSQSVLGRKTLRSIDFRPPCYPGDSGGPVVNRKGELIGIISNNYENHKLGIPKTGSAPNLVKIRDKLYKIINKIETKTKPVEVYIDE